MLPEIGGIGSEGDDSGTCVLEQAVRMPTISAIPALRRETMALILLEALLALTILVVIVWWTMFAGRKKGEIVRKEDEPPNE